MSALTLFNLQEKDLSLAQQRQEVAALEQELADQSALLQAQEAVAQHQERLRGLRAAQKDKELEAAQHQERLQEAEGRLYGGRVSNPRELRDLQADGEQIRGLLATAEEEVLRLLGETEEVAQGLQQAEAALAELRAHRAGREVAIQQQLQAFQQELQQLETQRAAVAEGVSQEEMRLYQRLQATRAGQPVARVEGGRCRGCHVAIPTREFQRARAGRELVQCSNCGRILFVG